MSEGLTLAGRYRLVSKLGQGGMGSVWIAEHLTLGTPVAVKLIDPSIAQSEEALARFRREAQSAAELRSAHVVHVMDYGVENGNPYIAMELLEGESLAARLSRVGRLAPGDTATILSQVARALTKAHHRNIIHRDLKPENIFLVREGDDELVKVLDFGIAKKLGLSSTSSGVKTHTGAMLGTPYYMSPEQAKGHVGVDHRTDIWSLAIITYECITGARPFDSETLASLLVAICTEPLPVPSQVAPVPPGFDDWFAQAASRDLNLRFQSAKEAVQQLQKVCGVVGSGSTLDNTAASRVAVKPPSDAALETTGGPSSITLNGGQKRSLRSVMLIALTVLALGAIGVVVGRALTKHDEQVTNASASPSQLQAGLAPTPQGNPPVPASGAVPQALLSAAAPASGSPVAAHEAEDAKSSRAPIKHSATASAAVKGGKTTGAATVSSAMPVASAKQTVIGNPPTHRDYDKSVGF